MPAWITSLLRLLDSVPMAPWRSSSTVEVPGRWARVRDMARPTTPPPITCGVDSQLLIYSAISGGKYRVREVGIAGCCCGERSALGKPTGGNGQKGGHGIAPSTSGKHRARFRLLCCGGPSSEWAPPRCALLEAGSRSERAGRGRRGPSSEQCRSTHNSLGRLARLRKPQYRSC